MAVAGAWLPALALAADYEYAVNPADTNTVTITLYTGTGGAVDIPATIDGKTVTILGSGSFSVPSLTAVTIPDSVETIAMGAFQPGRHTALARVAMGTGVTNVESAAFASCTNLSEVLFGPAVRTIGDQAFAHCSALTNAALPDSLESISRETFYECGKLAQVAFGTNVAAIGYQAFYGCSRLAEVALPDRVATLEGYAFAYCSSLRFAAIGAGTTNIGGNSFAYCTNLTEATFGAGLRTIEAYAFAFTALTNVVIPDGVVWIEPTAFESCTALANLIIGNGVTNGLWLQFSGYAALTNLVIGDGIPDVPVNAFSGCAQLAQVVVGSGVAGIGWSAFNNCAALQGIYFRGDAPTYEDEFFGDGSQATVYYLAGTTGWGETYAGRPTAPWLPETGAASISALADEIAFDIVWADGQSVVIEACDSITNQVWVPVATNVIAGGTSRFSESGLAPERYYRLREP